MNRYKWLVVGVVVLLCVPAVALAASHFTDTTGTTVLNDTDGPQVNLTGDTDTNLHDPFRNAPGTVELETLDGNATFSSPSGATVTVDHSEITGTYTNLTSLSVSGTNLTVDPEDKSEFVIGGGADSVNVSDATVDDGAVDAVYSASGSNVILVFNDLPADTTIGAYSVGSDTIIATNTTDAAGQLNLTLPTASNTIKLRTSDGPPTLSNPDPQGPQNSTVNSLSVDVADPNLDNGGQVTVEFSNSSGTIGTDTLTSNGTASVSVSMGSGGQHQYTVEATNDWGDTDSNTYQYKIPDELQIYEEGDPDSLVTTANVEVTFFQGDGSKEVFNKSTSDGTIKLTDLPVDQEMEVSAETSSYVDRKIFLDSIYQQEEIYLLNSGASADVITWQLDDLTGDFPASDTVLKIQRPLTKDFDGDGNDETQFQTIEGGRFGANQEFVTELKTSTKYRTVVQNDDGDRRVLGTYETAGDSTEVLEIGRISFSSDVEQGAVMQSALLEDSNGDRFIRITYNDSERLTSKLDINVTNTSSGQSIHDVTVTGEFGDHSELIYLPASAGDDASYKVLVNATRDGTVETHTEFVGDIAAIAQLTGISETILFWGAWLAIISIMGLVVIFDDALAAFIGWFLASAFTLLGAISVPGVALAFSGAIALLYNVARRA